MIRLKPSAERIPGRPRERWSSFDPSGPGGGFRALRFIDEQLLGPEQALQAAELEGLEVLTVVLEGSLIREDGTGGWKRQGAGDFRRSGPGPGPRLRARNESPSDSVRVVQCGLASDLARDLPPHEQRRFPRADRDGVWRLVASPDGRESSIAIGADALISSSILLRGQCLFYPLDPGRAVWLQGMRGRLRIADLEVGPGDGVAFEGETHFSLTALAPAELLVFDLA